MKSWIPLWYIAGDVVVVVVEYGAVIDTEVEALAVVSVDPEVVSVDEPAVVSEGVDELVVDSKVDGDDTVYGVVVSVPVDEEAMTSELNHEVDIVVPHCPGYLHVSRLDVPVIGEIKEIWLLGDDVAEVSVLVGDVLMDGTVTDEVAKEHGGQVYVQVGYTVIVVVVPEDGPHSVTVTVTGGGGP
jgi:hypothetical protein